MANKPDTGSALIPSAIVGLSIIIAGFAIKGALDRNADQLDGIRLALADTNEAVKQMAQARPAAPQPARRRGPDPNRRYTINTSGAPAKGPATAKVKIVEFSDFQ